MKKRILSTVLLLLAAALPAVAQNFSPVIGSQVEDASGNLLQSGSICFQPVNAFQKPTNFMAGGGGAVHSAPVCRSVINGVIGGPLNIASSPYTSPTGIQYAIWVTDDIANTTMQLGIAYICVNAVASGCQGGPNWSIDQWTPTGIQTLPFAGSSFLTGAMTATGAITAPFFHGLADISVATQRWSVLPQGCPGGYSPSHQDISGNFLDCNANSYQASGTTPGMIAQNPAGSQMITIPSGFFMNFGSSGSYTQMDSVGNTTLGGFLAINGFSSQVSSNCFSLGVNACQNGSLSFNGLRTDTANLHIDGQNANTYWLSPGRQVGNIGFGSTLWTSHMNENNMHSLVDGNTLFQITISHTGAGDTGLFMNNTTYGGATGASDQGAYGAGINVNEAPGTYDGAVVTGGVGVMTITTACSADCGNQGQSRTLINLSRPVTSGYLTARVAESGSTPAALTISSTVAVSTAWGLLTANVATPWGTPTGVGTTAETFNVNINTALSGAVSPNPFHVGDFVCFGGTHEEQARITAVGTPAGGIQSVTANLREAHAANTWLMANGACGSYIDLLAAHSSGGLRYPVPVIGSTSANVLQVISFALGGQGSQDYTGTNLFLSTFAAKNFSNGGSGTTVTMTLLGAGLQNVMQNAPSIWISGSGDSALNAACTNATYSATTQLLSCTIAGLTGSHITTATGAFAISSTNQFGNGDFVLYPGAGVLDVQNESIASTCAYSNPTCMVDGTFTLEPNNVTFTTGDQIEEPHHYTTKLHDLELYPTLQNPGPLQGLSHVIDSRINGPMTGGISIQNQMALSSYQYFGGLLTPPDFLINIGFWRNMLMTHNAPANGGAVLSIGPSLSGDTDVNYSYDIFSGHSQTCGQAHTLQLIPSTDTINLNCQSFNITTSLLFTFNAAQVASITPTANGVAVNGSVGINGNLSTTGTLNIGGVINIGMVTNFVRDSFNYGSANWTVTGAPMMTTGQADGFGTATATKIVTTAATTLSDVSSTISGQEVACVHARGNSGGETLTIGAYGFTSITATLTTSWQSYCSLNQRTINTTQAINITMPGGETVFFDATSSTNNGPLIGSGSTAWTGATPAYLPTTGSAVTTPTPAITKGNTVL